MKACECNESLGNTGVPGCQPLFKVTKKEIFVPTFDSTGARNSIDLTATFDQAFLDGKLNEADASKRWYPTPIIENVVSERAESAFDEAPSGNKDFLKSGTRSESYEIRNQSGAYKGQLDKARCFQVSKYVIDVDGSIRGMIDPNTTGFLFPIQIDNNSFDVNFNFQTDTTIGKLVVSYDYAQTEDDANLRMIAGSDITANLLSASGLLDINSTVTSITTTGFTVKLETIYGSASNLIVDQGLVIGDFSLAELSPTPGAVTLLTMTESPNGTYAFTFAAQTSGDVLELTPSKSGRDYTNVIANTILIP